MENIWNDEKDLLNRKVEAEFLSTYLLKRFENNKDKPFVLNLNAEWGFGKTFFLKNLSKDFKEKEYPVLYFDAWKNDYTKEPLLSFISEMDSLLKPFFTKNDEVKASFKETMNSAKNILLPIVIKKVTGFALDELEEKMNEESESDENKDIKEEITSVVSKGVESLLKKHTSIKNSISEFKKNMGILLTQKINLPMFIFIDELDRCRPNYAIELLENIKHIFDIPGIVFVIATDSKQLSHSINAVYGNNFASERYLKRFFDQEYTLTKPDNYLFAKYLFEMNNIIDNDKLFSPLNSSLYPDINLNVKLFSYFADYFGLSYRDQEQVATVLTAISLTWNNTNKIHLCYLLFLIILKQRSNDLFNKYLKIKAPTNKFLDEISEELELNKEMTFPDFWIDSFDKKNRDVNFVDIINYYMQIKDTKNLLNTNTAAMSYEKRIANNINNNRTNFDTYPELVLRCGQFT